LQRGEFQPGLHHWLAHPYLTTGWHTHTCDQILVVTSGSGMVATEGGTPQEINIGDVVHIKAGERHWHGAKANTTMGHITITAVGGQAKWG
jgi:quercetin dioxygenase-like cupin family protein